MDLPNCLDCKYADLGHPCRTKDGEFNFALAAARSIARGRRFADADIERDDDADDWIADCEYELVEDHPDLILPFVVEAMNACETPMDAVYLAAGTIERALVRHGPLLIGDLETIAASSAKVRYILSGVWSQSGSIDVDVWARLGRAIGGSGRMSDDQRAASDGSPPVVLDEQAASALMKERVPRLQLGRRKTS